MAISSVEQSSARRVGSSTVMREVSSAFGTVRRLSKLSAHSTGMPSAGPRGISVGMPLIVRVAGAMRTALSTPIAAGRVRMHPGRRPTENNVSLPDGRDPFAFEQAGPGINFHQIPLVLEFNCLGQTELAFTVTFDEFGHLAADIFGG